MGYRFHPGYVAKRYPYRHKQCGVRAAGDASRAVSSFTLNYGDPGWYSVYPGVLR